MAQAILDLYPDMVSSFGLIGCALVTVGGLAVLAGLVGVAGMFFVARLEGLR